MLIRDSRSNRRSIARTTSLTAWCTLRTVSEPSQSEPSRPVVHVVEDDADARQATARLLQAAGYAVQTYESAGAFLERLHLTGAGYLVLDVQLPGTSGLELQEMLTKATDVLPVVFVTGHGDIPM